MDFHVFSTAIGSADDGYAEFSQTLSSLLYPLRHQSCTDLGIGSEILMLALTQTTQPTCTKWRPV